jgi:hypothetical protein
MGRILNNRRAMGRGKQYAGEMCGCHCTSIHWNAGLYYSSMAARRLYSTHVTLVQW